MEINQEVLDNAIEIYETMKVENIAPYMPANGTEGMLFEARWCDNCCKNLECGILSNALAGKQPMQWIYWNNKPICTTFEKVDEP